MAAIAMAIGWIGRTVCLAALVGEGATEPSAPPGAEVAACVGKESIRVAEVDRFVRLAAGDRVLEPEARALLQAGALEELVGQRLVLAYAAQKGDGAKPAEIDAALAAFQARLTAEGKTLQSWLGGESITEHDLRRQLGWEIVWTRYREKFCTEDRLQQYFSSHRRQFDGTELEVSQILIRPADPADAQAWAAAEERAEKIRQDILSGKVVFEEAARQHSQSPSAAGGGRLGSIGRDGPMPEPFTAAAFALDAGEMSPPVRTVFGVHLIRCDAVQPGSKTWLDARAALETALAEELRDKIAALQRKSTPVTYTGVVPRFEPENGKLVIPEGVPTP